MWFMFGSDMSDVAGDFRRQLPSMIGMAGMFVATIFLAMYIRPWYDKAGLQAFGEAGASQLRYIGLELIMIFIFTAAILMLAKYKKEWIIKYGIMGILFIALLYANVPLSHQILVDDSVTPFEYDAMEERDAEYLTEIGMDQYLESLRFEREGEIVNTIRLMQWGEDDPLWQSDIAHGNITSPYQNLIAVPGPDAVSISNGEFIHTLSLSDGTVESTYTCLEFDNQGEVITLLENGCAFGVETEDSLYIVDYMDNLHRFATYPDFPNQTFYQATWSLPPELSVQQAELVEIELLSNDHLMMVSQSMAAVIELEETTDIPPNSVGEAVYAPVQLAYNATSNDGFSALDIGYSNVADKPMEEATDGQQLIVLGTKGGDVVAWSYSPQASPVFSEETKVSINNFADGIRDVRLTDIDATGYTELLITTDKDARLLYGASMVQRLIIDVPEGEDVAVTFGETPQDVVDETITLYSTTSTGAYVAENGEFINASYSTSSGVVDSSMFLVGGLVIEDIPTIIGILFSILLMVLLYVHSEWYVVNTVGILVGSGVIVMLGVSFVPTLIMVFMIAAAVYDAWAVYKSKHMLDLADTMMNLNLPILLVAPQDSDYSMRTERTTTVHETEETASETVQDASRERVVVKSNDAMLMGLGDVIFPGMLVLSTLQYVGGDDGFIMAMTTLVGSLIGYSVLMYYVGKGQAQAGLPLLNGGAILGYIVGGLLTIGMAMFQFNISF